MEALRGNEVGNQFGADGGPGKNLFILSGIAVIGYDRIDPLG
jgi:hypothetical protein